ncbi:hypothetical protein WA026_013545 [Henosepilachna vigintioctopunctata]|uniref:Uncharacterized protein n=1 Tax=Henosepilachna vigintioctopunctata TaxID=420089 RepID=A0AAW1VG14_9CUCU
MVDSATRFSENQNAWVLSNTRAGQKKRRDKSESDDVDSISSSRRHYGPLLWACMAFSNRTRLPLPLSCRDEIECRVGMEGKPVDSECYGLQDRKRDSSFSTHKMS